MNRIAFLVAIAASAIASSATAQIAYVLNRDPGAGTRPAMGAVLPSLAAPTGLGIVPSFRQPALPNYYAASIVATGTPLPPVANEGGLAIDQDARLVYATNGTSFLTQDAHSLYGSVATAPTATLPLLGWPGGPLTGLAVSSAAGLLYVCDGFTCQARSKTFPYAAASAAFVLPPFLGAPGATGLDYDAATGTLWACNVAGATIEFTTTGAPVAAFPAPPIPGIAPVRGVAINSTAGPFALPPSPGQTPGFHVCLTNGDKIFDALPPFSVLDVASSFESHCRGLAISADPVLFQGRYVASTLRHKNDPGLNPGPGFAYPQIGVGRPTCKFLPGSNPLLLDGAPASVPVVVVADLAPLAPAGSGLVLGDDVLWINPLPSFFFSVLRTTDAAGHAELELPMFALPVGLQIATQWLIPDASAYLGFDFSDALLFRVGLH